jgi:hypothetical protein
MKSSVARLNAVHDRVKGLDWSATYHESAYPRPTKYKIPKNTKDPFKHLIRQYSSMEEEKDDRMYGSIADVINRVGQPDRADRGWIETLKFMLPILTQLELGAMQGARVCMDSLDNPELKSGYMAQVMDEVRHFNQQTYLQRYWAKHWEDPEAFARAFELRDRDLPIFGPMHAFTEGLWNEDPMTIAISFQAMAETAYTNPIFIAVTELAAANADHVTPTVFLSIQSDEARHMANGYAGLAAVLSEPDNLPMLQPEVDGSFLQFSVLLNGYFGVLYDYMPTNRARSYAEIWDEWVWENFVGAYMGRLQPFGLEPPASAEFARDHSRLAGHASAVFYFGAWPLAINRFDPLGPRDFEWLEEKYPGWYSTYGKFWEQYKEASDPASGATPFALLPGGKLPPICQVCNSPCYLPDPYEGEASFEQLDGEWYSFCSIFCQMAFQMFPEKFPRKPFYTRYDGWSLSEFIIKQGLLRADGKTLLGQPHLESDRLWTIDDIRRHDVAIENPARVYGESQNRGTAR